MRLSSDDVPAVVSTATTKKASGAKLYLFTDVLAVVQVIVYIVTSLIPLCGSYRVKCPQNTP